MLINKTTYKDIPFFISKNSFTNDFNTSIDLTAIRQAIKNIILTNNGERAFNFHFGCNIYANLFENITLELITSIQSKISSNLRIYEHRVQVNDVKILETGYPNEINVVVDFGIPSLNIFDVIEVSIARTR